MSRVCNSLATAASMFEAISHRPARAVPEEDSDQLTPTPDDGDEPVPTAAEESSSVIRQRRRYASMEDVD